MQAARYVRGMLGVRPWRARRSAQSCNRPGIHVCRWCVAICVMGPSDARIALPSWAYSTQMQITTWVVAEIGHPVKFGHHRHSITH